MKFTRILYATDFSPVAQVAWTYVKKLSRIFHGEIVALHVVPPLAELRGAGLSHLFEHYWHTAMADAHRCLAELQAEAQADRLKLTSRVELGRVADTILTVGGEEQADLILVGSVGKRAWEQGGLGSTADELVRRASCPVMTARPVHRQSPEPQFARLLYPTDFSLVADAAWPLVETLAHAAKGVVTVLHLLPQMLDVPGISQAEMEALDAGYRRQAEESAAALLARSALPRERIQVVLDRRPTAEIVDFAERERIDTIVMGTRGWSGLQGWTLGSVAHRVLQTASCPVLTVGHGAG